MSDSLLATKLYIPPVRSQLVSRPRLIQQLNEGLQRMPGVTLISAPAGFGKTTLVSDWLAGCTWPVAWLSLDEGDNDTPRFLTYLVAALQTIVPDFGSEVLRVFSQGQSPSTESVLTTLLNEITTIPKDFIFVLDDYHAIDSKAIDDAHIFLLEHMPPQMHLVITTREDPNLPLARLRARNQLTELRVADLRFSTAEAAEFLNQVMGLELSAEDIATLETRTEGWVAGLQLVALSMRGREDIPGFIKSFTGDHRYIVDYLVEEVLQHQPEHVRNFLLQTSILDHLSGSLCEAVTGQDESQKLLDSLERGNQFVIPLDDQRRWFRYHHLFGDVLRAHLMTEQADKVPVLHQRASKWYAQNDLRSSAIRHALAARDYERAADLTELAWRETDRSRQSARWLGWAKALPDQVVRKRPVLTAGYAWALLDRGELEAAEARLREAELWLDTSAEEIIVVDKEEFRFLSASIAAARAYLALAVGDISSTVKYGRRALDHLPEEEHLRRGIPASLLGVASWTEGDLDAADRALVDSMTSFQKAGNILFANTSAYVLADLRRTLGRLRQALDTYQGSLRLAEDQGKFVLWGTADLHTGLSELYCEQNDLGAAKEHLLKSKELGEQSSLPRWRFRWSVAQARYMESCGEWDTALELLDEAERSYLRGPLPDLRPVAASRARIWIKQNRLAEAESWAREQGLSPEDDLSFVREYEHITFARVLIAQYKRDRADRSILDALRLLERLLKAAEEGRRNGSMIEILILQSLALEAQDNIPSALVPLEYALALAEPEGYIRIFIDEGIPMARLLSEAVTGGIMPSCTGKLLAAFQSEGPKKEEESKRSPVQTLIEPLSERELEVLQLIAQGLSNREISERLFLALSTVKGYNRTIFGKLQVQRRTEAIARARELGLV